MCLQNYLIFYLEVIPPLSSFIALYMTEVGEQRRMRPSQWLSGGSVYALTLARRQGPRSPFIAAPLFPEACFFHLEAVASPPGSFFIASFQTWIFIVFLGGREVRFREAVLFEWAANAALAEAAALALPERRLPPSVSSEGPRSGAQGPWHLKAKMSCDLFLHSIWRRGGRVARLLSAGSRGSQASRTCESPGGLQTPGAEPARGGSGSVISGGA